MTPASQEGVGYAKDSNSFPEVSTKMPTPEVDPVFGQENRRLFLRQKGGYSGILELGTHF